MASAQSDVESEDQPLGDITVVDTDVHISLSDEQKKEIAQQLEWPYNKLLDPTEGSGGYRGPMSGSHTAIPGKMSAFGGGSPPVHDIEEGIKKPLCEGMGVDYPIINRLPPYDIYPDTEQILQEMPATNDLILEQFLEGYDDVWGLIPVLTRVPDKAAEEIDRLGDHDKFVGILIHGGGQEWPLGDPKYDPIYAAAEDHDLTVCYHTGGKSMMWEMAQIVKGLGKTQIGLHGLAHPYSMMLTVTSLIVNGVPEKFPDLNFVPMEAGIGWVPYMMSRLNREYSTWRSQAPLLEKMPEEYIRDQFYFTTQPLGEFSNPGMMKHTIEQVGTDSIVFSSDHPHFDFDNPEAIRGIFNHLSREEQEKVFSKNAIEAFGLPV